MKEVGVHAWQIDAIPMHVCVCSASKGMPAEREEVLLFLWRALTFSSELGQQEPNP
jgi:hypothetical protein